MKFSQILNQEISKKRRIQADENENVKKSKDMKGGGDKIVDDVDDDDNDNNNNSNDNDHEIDDNHSQLQPQISDKDRQVIDSISDEELHQRLTELGEYDDSLSKLELVKRLRVIIKTQERRSRYKRQIEKESGVDSNIEVTSITPENKEKLMIQTRLYIKQLVKEWETNSTNKNASIIHETKKDFVILLYKLRTDDISDNILISLSTILYYLQQNDFRKANESYMKLSIGNVAWPIGLVGVGIHQRSADLKITNEDKSKGANIMIDDSTRRWIVGVKRIITERETRLK